MAYNNINWQNNSTPLNADNMNNIMEGISLALGYNDRFKIPIVGSEGITKPPLNLTIAKGTDAVQQALDTDSYSWKPTNSYVQSLLVDKNLIALDENGKVDNIGASGKFSSVFGGKGLALGKRSFVYGTSGIAYGDYSSAGGDQALAYGLGSDAIGCATSAIGPYSSVKGMKSKAVGEGSDAGGYETQAIGDFSFTRGHKTIANSFTSAAFGSETVTNKDVSCQFVIGKHNQNKGNTLFEVGNGSDQNNKSNAFEVTTGGQALLGDANILDDNRAIATKKYVDDKVVSGGSQTETGEWTPSVSSVAEGIAISFSDAVYTKNGNNINLRAKMQIDYEGLSNEDTTYLFSGSYIQGLPFNSKSGFRFENMITMGGTLARLDCSYNILGLSSGHLNTGRMICMFSVLTKNALYNIVYKSSGSLTVYINIDYLIN